jgi:predicted permease
VAILLLATALAANTLVFSAADSLVFHRAPYRDVDRLVEIRQLDARTGQPGPSGFLSPPLLVEWRKQTDLFSGVEGYLNKVIFLSGAGEPERVDAADVTTGLIDLLGTRPRWGRTFTADDAREADAQPVLIAESLARERFGDPAAAVGQRLETTAEPLAIVGVMPAAFRYPDGSQRIWRALDPRGPLAAGFGAVSSIARLAPGVPLDTGSSAARQRSGPIGHAAGARAGYAAALSPLRSVEAAAAQRRMLFVLVGAALCLLLLACANVASLEMASALERARTYAIQLAVGASRGSLIRSALLEGLLLVGAAAAAALAIAGNAVNALLAYFPRWVAEGSANPIDMDTRALGFMVAIAAAAWLLAALPVAIFAWRSNLVDLLKLDGATATPSRRGAIFRGALTVAQVALAVLLLVGSVLYVRTYLALIALQKGFDSEGVASISLTIPPQAMGAEADRRVLAQTILDRIRARPGVIAAFDGAPPPSSGDSPMTIERLEVDDRAPVETSLGFPKLRVEADYFKVLRIPLLAGRMFEPGEPPTNVLISEALASRLWPGQDALGHRFREHPQMPWYHVVGVVGHVRLLADGTTGPDRLFQLYFARQPPRPAPAPPPGVRFAMPSFGFLTVTARVDSRARAADLYQTVRGVDPRNILKVEFADDSYAAQFADRLLATRLISGFGALAFVVSAAGIYGLMAFLVASRSREMGIRIALGAEAGDIKRLVLGSSARLAAIGAAIGIGAALAASRWVESQFFGVNAMDPLTLAAVGAAVVAVALAAAWQPAWRASRVDPTSLLRS